MIKWAERLYHHRRFGLVIIVLLTLFFAWQIPRLTIQTQFRDLYPKAHAHTKLFEQYPQFGSLLSVILVVHVREGTIYNAATLTKIQEATKLIDLLPGIDHNQIFSIASSKNRHIEATTEGIRASNFLVGPVPRDLRGLAKLRSQIHSAPDVLGILVSRHEDAALIQANFIERLTDYRAIFTGVNEIIEQLQDDKHLVYAAGHPILSGWIDFYKSETLVILAVTFTAMILLLTLYMANLPGIAIPSIVAIITAVWGLGIAARLNINLDPLIMVLPMLLIARSFSHAIQACERYFEIYAETQDQRTACVQSIVSIFPPGVLGMLTDAAALFLVGIAPIPMLEKVSIMAGFWALSLIPADLFLTPILLASFPPPRNPVNAAAVNLSKASSLPHTESFKRALGRVLQFVVDLTGEKRASSAAALLVVLLVAAVTAKQMPLGDSHAGTSILWPDSAYNAGVKNINERFAGFDLFQIIVESSGRQTSMHSPAALNLMQMVQHHMEFDPEVTATFSFADLVAQTNRLLHEGLPKWGIIPENERDAAMLSQLALRGAGPGESERFFTGDLTAATVNVWYKDHRSATVERALKHASAFDPSELVKNNSGLSLRIASGSMGMLAAINQTVSQAQLEMLLAVVILIFAMCAISYRSLMAATLLLVPVNFSNLLATALMVHLNIGLDVNTLPVLAIGTGIGIDYAIYLMTRISEEFPRWGSYEAALTRAILTTGRAVFFTATTVVLSIAPWYFLSSLRFQAQMGLLIGALMIINMVAALIVIPLLVSIFKPKFVGREALAAKI